MKHLIHILFFLSSAFSLNAQTEIVFEKGTSSFLSSRNVYVKFATTKDINIGDTLFNKKGEAYLPALKVNNKSSTSAVCTSLISDKIEVGDVFFAKRIVEKKQEQPVIEEEEKLPATIEEELAADETIAMTGDAEARKQIVRKQQVKGRISAASYSNLSDYQDVHRMRYAFTFRGKNLRQSRFSIDNHITFRHTIGEWQEVKENINQALKVYALSVNYEIDSNSNLTFGRKINPKISSMGALDGFQYEKGWGNILLGVLAGSRPDYTDYSFNFNLFQTGAYISRMINDAKHFQQSTLGFIEQRNKGNIDRRLIYFQHTGELVKNLNLFSSFEVDLYEKINNEQKNKTELTNIFVSLRYRATKKIRLSASYDARKNIIYYESYKNYIDQLIENETRQGLRFGFSHRPVKTISWGVNTSMRFQHNSHRNDSKNLNTYLNFSRIPVLKIRAAIRANFLQTQYIKSQIFSINLSKEIIKQKLNGELYYRWMDYNYASNNSTVHQNITGASFSLRLLKKLTLYLYYEGTFDNRGQVFQRYNTKIIQRF